MRIALVGYGKMGAALLAQWLAQAELRFPRHRFTIIDPAIGADVPSHPYATFHPEPPPETRFDLIIAAVKPQVMDSVLPDYSGRLAPDGFVASIAAGCSIERVRSLVGGAPVVRIMPNLPAAIGQGVSGLCADPDVTSEQRQAVEELMTAAGTALWVEDEDQLDRLTAVAGSGPGYMFEIASSYVDAAQALGFDPDTARRMVLDTMAGTIEMARQSTLLLDTLRDGVTSKGGTTAAGLAALNGDGAVAARLHATLAAAYDRAVALR